MRLIHITDPHLSTLDGISFLDVRGKRRSGYLSWYKKRRFVHRREILDKLTDAVARHAPDLVLVTGDLVHIGLEREIEEAGAWLNQLGPPGKVILVPGNHDNYASDSLQSMYRIWSDYLPLPGGVEGDYTAGYPFVHRENHLRITAVNTSCVTRIFSAQGELGTMQRERLADSLGKAAKNDFQCLLIHHPPWPGITRNRKALRDASELEKIIRLNQPELVLYGHIHCNREDRLDETRAFCTASASSAIDASYRIFDLSQVNSHWQCRGRLMSLQGNEFALCGETSWQTKAS